MLGRVMPMPPAVREYDLLSPSRGMYRLRAGSRAENIEAALLLIAAGIFSALVWFALGRAFWHSIIG